MMKTLKGILLLLGVLTSACKPDYPLSSSEPLAADTSGTVPVYIRAQLTPLLERIDEEGLFMEWRGRATGDRVGKARITLSHLACNPEEGSYFPVSLGTFYLRTDDYSSTLSGTYFGYGERGEEQMIMTGEVSILSGTGELAVGQGSLRLTIATLDTFAADPPASDIRIEGNLHVSDSLLLF